MYKGFDVGDLSEDGPDDIEGMDVSAAHVAKLLSTEPTNSMFTRKIMLTFNAILLLKIQTLILV